MKGKHPGVVHDSHETNMAQRHAPHEFGKTHHPKVFGNPKVIKEAHQTHARKHGGRVHDDHDEDDKEYKKGGAVKKKKGGAVFAMHGSKAAPRLDRPRRKSGGRVHHGHGSTSHSPASSSGAERSPLSSASKITTPASET